MIWRGVSTVLALCALAVPAAGTATASSDHGIDRPPRALTASDKAIWMSEWVACRRRTLRHLAYELHMKVPASRTPQETAKALATRAMLFLYDLENETDAGIDGCRNGLLWGFYH
ncbi:MAG: hypothetical protein WCH31_05860 [Actinomycetes bacterium]